MRKLLTARRAPDDKMTRGIAAPHRRGVLTAARKGLNSAVVAAVLVAGGCWFGAGGSASAAAASAAPSPYGDTSCVDQGAGVTCTGTYGGNRAYDPLAPDQLVAGSPTVTVSQTTNLTHQDVDVSWTNFTPSYDTQYNNEVGIGLNASKFMDTVDVFECKGEIVDGQQQPPQSAGLFSPVADDCYSPQVGNSGPYNEVQTYTLAGGMDIDSLNPNGQDPTLSCETPGSGSTCGTGTTEFQIETKQQNSFLGCDDTTQCYLVVIPNWGGDDGSPAGSDTQPGDGAGDLNYTQDCSDHEFDGPQNFNTDGLGTAEDDLTSCTWADRFVIPLSFAPTPQEFCSSNDYQFNSEGSPELEQAMQQWQPAWCTAKQGAVDFGFDSGVNEYEARSDFLNGGSALTASADVAFATDPASSQLTAGSSRKFTYAPIANTGFAIAYDIDDVVTGAQITDLKLDARLLAKLLTNSYSYSFNSCSDGQKAQSATCDPAVDGNPQTIFDDPEFYQLNPEYTEADFLGSDDSGATGDYDTEPLVIAGDSDMTYELTRWVESQPDAAAFLAGQPDPWGMHVNTYYKTGQSYPVSSFLELDPGFIGDAQQQSDPAATMQATWDPITGQDNVDENLLEAQPSGTQLVPTCTGGSCLGGSSTGTPTYQFKALPAETSGEHTLFAVVDTGDSGAFQFPTAQLVNPAGNAVGLSTDTMAAALGSMKTNPDKVTQYQDFSDTSPNAYPLTEVQYAMVPTCGESPSRAAAIANFLTDAASSQLMGTSTGELPDFGGYLPLTAAQKAQTLAAAQQVRTQSCTSPPPDTSVSGRNPGNNGAAGGAGVGGNAPAVATGPASGPTSAGSPVPQTSISAKSSIPAEPVALGVKGSDDGSLAKIMLPIALILGALLVIGGPIAYSVGNSGGGFAFRKRGNGVTPAGTSAAGTSAGDPSGAGDPAGETPDAGDGGGSTTGGTGD